MTRTTTIATVLGTLLALTQGCTASSDDSLEASLSPVGVGSGLGTTATSSSSALPEQTNLYKNITFYSSSKSWASDPLTTADFKQIWPYPRVPSSDTRLPTSGSVLVSNGDIEAIKKNLPATITTSYGTYYLNVAKGQGVVKNGVTTYPISLVAIPVPGL